MYGMVTVQYWMVVALLQAGEVHTFLRRRRRLPRQSAGNTVSASRLLLGLRTIGQWHRSGER